MNGTVFFKINKYKVSAEDCYTELQTLKEITPQNVVDLARNEDSKLHNDFEWDTEHFVDEKLMSPKKGAPVLVHLNRFTGWKCTFTVSYMESVYSAEQIVNIINLAGFGLGIGSGRSSGYGRYHVESIKAV